MESTSHPADQISLISVLFLAFRVCFRHLGSLILLNLCLLLLSIPLITHPGVKTAMYAIVKDFLFDPLYKASNPLRAMTEQLRFQFKRSLLVEAVRWVAFVIILISIAFWISRTEVWLRYVTIIAIYGLVLWHLIGTFIYPVLANDQKLSASNGIRVTARLVLLKPFVCFFYAAICFLLFLVGVLLLGPILLVVPVFIAIVATLGYQQLIGSDFKNVYILASKGY